MPNLKILKSSKSYKSDLSTVADKNSKAKTAHTKGDKNKVIALLFVLLIVIGFIAVNQINKGPKIYAEAAGHKIYLSDIKQLRGSSNDKEVSNKQVATV